MKNHLFCLVLSFFFLLGSASYSHALGGEDVPILNVKTGSPLCSLVIPDKYVNKDKSLKLPLVITLKGDSNYPVITLQSNSLYVALPSNLSGAYLMEVQIGDFALIMDVKF